MSLNLHSVINSENTNNELVWLQATEKINLKGYALVDRTFDSKENVSNEFRHIFFFPNLVVEKNDWVQLFTGNGKYQKVQSTDKSCFIHKLYWQSDKCVWNNNGGDTATLIKCALVKSVKVPAVKK
ncbi:hypothetical protein [Flavobacterium sp. HJSW_4]|uniref:hypothetical protein n=1 Tax=Flavobacterium sp. HJSW_4 TaxID=3344660 RepID=UPI0035F34149